MKRDPNDKYRIRGAMPLWTLGILVTSLLLTVPVTSAVLMEQAKAEEKLDLCKLALEATLSGNMLWEKEQRRSKLLFTHAFTPTWTKGRIKFILAQDEPEVLYVNLDDYDELYEVVKFEGKNCECLYQVIRDQARTKNKKARKRLLDLAIKYLSKP